ncbi:hypothetical protein AXF42_Ash017333 [Apostasia shenzhenica]|uniref:Uncharacterized protein n=1 Tax=Apostasia shenzhenica TaxID=1088818 RepID=A0A2I0BDD2_9ASPA|nr:hypothetical protein AXF42_Ash017333 [Apostasia shenzhenica]
MALDSACFRFRSDSRVLWLPTLKSQRKTEEQDEKHLRMKSACGGGHFGRFSISDFWWFSIIDFWCFSILPLRRLNTGEIM